MLLIEKGIRHGCLYLKGKTMKIKALIDYYDTYEKRDIKKDEIYETTDERGELIVSVKYAQEVRRGRKKNAVSKASDR